MSDFSRRKQLNGKKKKTGKQRPNMMSNQGPGEDASTGKFSGMSSGMSAVGRVAGLIARSRNKKKAV